MTAVDDMKPLLTAIQAALVGAAGLSYVTDSAIYIADSLDIIQSAGTFPCIGIKDGDIERVRFVNAVDVIMDIHIGFYQLLVSGDDALMGNEPTTYGVLDAVTDIRNVLDDNYLSVSGIYNVDLPDESGSELMDAEDLAVLRKVITYSYYKRITG